jgi:deoxyribodipyrimidine photo-lyase
MKKINQALAVFWFRRDLRLDDNTALFHALHSDLKVLPIFIFDTNILSQLDHKKDRRVDFIHQSLVHMQKKLLQFGTSLVVRTGEVHSVFEELIEEYRIQKVYVNRDYEPYAVQRDIRVKLLLDSKGIEWISYKDQVIFEADEVLKKDGTPYTVFTPYSVVWKRKLEAKFHQAFPSEKRIDSFLSLPPQHIPSLASLGFELTDLVWTAPQVNEAIVCNYEKTRDLPAIEGTSLLSVHLRFGTISIRKCVLKATQLNEHWLNELIWREFFMSIIVHFPHVITGAFRKKYEAIQWQNNEQEFQAWCEGMTGYPIVDAGMRQLNTTGWMHNRVRMIVASFLSKHLLIDWRWGEAYFASHLLDYELASNNGNWQWAAGCGCDAAPYFRVFNPYEQTKRFDPNYLYIRRWVAEIDSMNYPSPIVEHNFARNRAIQVYKEGLAETTFSI